jgi:hypothetical protein
MASNIELYEAIKDSVGSEAAKMLAEALPRSEQLATKEDIERLKADIERLKADMTRWMLTFFVPLWIGVYGTLAAVVFIAIKK